MFYPPLVDPGTTVKEAKHDIDRLLLITEALWTLIKQQNGYSDDVLMKLVQDIDRRKAVTAKAPVACPACGKANTADRIFCMYCGKPLPGSPFGP